MNIYLVVEGPVGEKLVYSHWIPLINPSLKVVNDISEVDQNNVLIVSGGGYPAYLSVIEDAVNDVNANTIFDRLVIAVDSEDMTYEEKNDEITEHLDSIGVNVDYRLVVQHFCLETWALGNKLIVPRNTECGYVRKYRGLFDVLTDDPAHLPALDDEDLNRAQFAEKYLRKLLNAKFRNLSYSKRNPKALLHDKYYERVKLRLDETGHIASFNDFLLAFV